MADIDTITASSGTTYNIKDSTARDSISRTTLSSQVTAAQDFNVSQKYLVVNGCKTATVYIIASPTRTLSAGEYAVVANLPEAAKPVFNTPLSAYDCNVFTLVSKTACGLAIKPRENIASGASLFIGGTYSVE